MFPTSAAALNGHKPLLVVAVALAAMAAVLFGGARALVQRFDAIELDQAADKSRQALRALAADLNQLAVSTRDYAEWDDAQEFIAGRDAQFVQANFSLASLDGMQVDRMAILDRNGAVVFAASIDERPQRLSDTLTPELVALVRSLHDRVGELRSLPSVQRIVATEDGLLAFSVVEIARSDRSQPTGATLFFGRYLQEDEVARLRETSQLPAELRVVAPSEFSSAPERAAFGAGSVTGIAAVTDWTGRTLAELSVTTPREIGALGRRTTAILMSAIGILALACSALFLFLMQRQRRHWTQQLALQARHERILGNLEESIVLADAATGRLIHGNAAFLKTLNCEDGELPNYTLADVFVGLNVLDMQGLRECQLRARDGRSIECELNVTRLVDQDPPLLCVIARDMTQRRQAEERLREKQAQLVHLAEHDVLTGLPNRSYLQTRSAKLLQRIAAQGRTLGLLYIDIDNFKNINDSRGHGFGDRLLKIVAKRLRHDTAAEDVVLRMGGDEFVVLASLQNEAAAKDIAQRLLAAIAAPITLESVTISVTASIGVALYPTDGDDVDTLLKNADIALYQAKDRGRSCFNAFADDMNLQLREHVVLEQALRRAIDTEQIRMVYQPVIDLHTGLLVSFEALARWTHPEMGAVPPGRFIPVAERSGLIAALGEQVVRDVVAQLREWRDAGLTLAPVAVNIAPIQFERTDFATYVHEVLLEYDMDPRLIAFEVTESALLRDSNRHIVAIDSLRHAGSRVYIDDFGTGFSNLGYLKTLPIDAVKIDRSFVQSIETDANDAAIVSSIIAVAKQLRLDTIAEGIETQSQAERLRELGCLYGQGYFFSKPMPADQCRTLLEQLTAATRHSETTTMRALRTVAV